MRKNLGVKPCTYPQPVFMVATYDENGNPDVMNAAWAGISSEAEISFDMGSTHKTTANILKRKAFTVSMANVENVVACDYVGIVSGNKDPEKFKKSGFTAVKSDFVDAPLIDELPIALECELISYDEKTCRLVGKIVNLSVDEKVLDKDGNVDVKKAKPITYDPFNHNYVALGEIVGKAFSDGAKLK